ncbi:MAG: ACP S-malonyltransferase [Eubacteriaceae bacterium]|nr:ACP S-malonyltransferase [Eubacteriaceae bacterium]
MDKIAFLFPGQGAHAVGMGKSIVELSPSGRGVFDKIETLRPGTKIQCFEGPAEILNQTVNTQPCIFTVEMAATMALNDMGLIPQAVAGFSLGEISGLVASGILSIEDGLTLVIARSQAMKMATQKTDATMVAVLKLNNDVVEALCQEFSLCFPVNYNCPDQLVVALNNKDLPEFLARVKALGGRGLPLGLSGGFHSPYMTEATNQLEPNLANLSFSKGSIPLYGNATALPYPESPNEIKSAILYQINHPVFWEKTIHQMIADGITTFIEVGPGKTLSGFFKKINSKIKIFHSDDPIKDFYEKQKAGKEWSLEC